jgi:CRISPR system Cascade subunit CasD
MRHTLLIPLAGPMQAWGSRSRFDDRDTHLEPTKSGVLGLVCAALGRDRAESIADLDALLFGVRVEAPGRVMTDYQTAQRVARAGGGSLTTVTSHRHYLADARFLAGLAGDDLPLLTQIEAALHDPHWPLSLGRKSYPLSQPPYLPEGSLRPDLSLETALCAEPWHPIRRTERPPEEHRLALEDAAGASSLADQPLHYGERRFGLRRVHFRVLSGSALPPRVHFQEGGL